MLDTIPDGVPLVVYWPNVVSRNFRLHFAILYGIEVFFVLTGMLLMLAAFGYRSRVRVHSNLRRIVANAMLHYVLLAPFAILIVVVPILYFERIGVYHVSSSGRPGVLFLSLSTLQRCPLL